MKDFLRYDEMAARHIEGAYRNLVREIMAKVAAEGLPGAHHFYVSFRTGVAGVTIPDFLRQEYPKDMTVVLEHQFWDLDVREDGFSVTLSFRNRPERLTIPFEAITSFVDPSVKFGVEFQAVPEPAPDPLDDPPIPPDEPADPSGKSAQVVALDAFRKK